jgi:hypothetical protein
MSKHCVLSLKPQLRLERRGQHVHNETEQPNHSASLGDSITSSTRIRFSVHTGTKIVTSRTLFSSWPRQVAGFTLHNMSRPCFPEFRTAARHSPSMFSQSAECLAVAWVARCFRA